MKKKIEHDNIQFDSEEERLFYLYVKELKENGFVKNFIYQPKPFTLSEPVKYSWKKEMKNKSKEMESTLLREHIYSPDFWIDWNFNAQGIFYTSINDYENKLDRTPFVNNIYNDGLDAGSFIEVKPNFDFQNMSRLATINIKWTYAEHKMLVQIIKPIGDKNCLFAKTFVPQEAMFTSKTKQLKKYKFKTKSLDEFIKIYE